MNTMSKGDVIAVKINLKTVGIGVIIFIVVFLSGCILFNNTIEKENLISEKDSKKITELPTYSEADEGVLEENAEMLLAFDEGAPIAETAEGSAEGDIPETWDMSKVYAATDSTGKKVPVPIGYVASGADGENTVNTGFVIYEGNDPVTNENAWEQSKIRNQWVWVPVADASRIYTENSTTGKKMAKLYTYSSSGTERTTYSNSSYEPGVLTSSSYDNEKYFAQYGMQGMTKDSLLKELETEFESTIESIEKYGGFYIGRYETGGLNTKVPVVKRMQSGSSLYNSWYACYTRMKNIGTNEKIRTGLIWGSLWDETLQWLIDSGNKTYEEIAKDSTSWGNYNNATFEYTTTSGTKVTKSSGSSTQIPAGSTEYTNANNIYDLAGGYSWEWTAEASGSDDRGLRGGYCSNFGTNYQAAYRSGTYPSYGNSARAYFYIK